MASSPVGLINSVRRVLRVHSTGRSGFDSHSSLNFFRYVLNRLGCSYYWKDIITIISFAHTLGSLSASVRGFSHILGWLPNLLYTFCFILKCFTQGFIGYFHLKSHINCKRFEEWNHTMRARVVGLEFTVMLKIMPHAIQRGVIG